MGTPSADEIQPVASRLEASAAVEDQTSPHTAGCVDRLQVDDVPASGAKSPKHSKAQLATIMIMLYFSVFLAALDSTITITALPTISAHFSSSAGYTWVGSAYLLATAASAPSWGALSNIWGRKPALLSALAIFFLGSLVAGVSTSMTMLIAGRAVQGTGGGGLLILVIICTADLFSMRTRGLVYGMESLIWATAAGVGPVLGGLFSEVVNWRWCFYIALPCSGLAFIVLALFLKLESPSTPVIAGLIAIDWIGSVTIVGATLTLLLGLEFGGVIFPWSSAKVICLIVFGVVIAAGFLFNEAKFARYPVMPLRLFKHWPNVAALIVGFLHALTYFAASYYLPLYAQAVRGYSPLKSGLFILPFEISLSLSSCTSGILIRLTGRYLDLLYLGLSLLVLGCGMFIHLDSHSTTTEITLLQIAAGVGTGLAYPGPLLALQARIAGKNSATATSTFGFIRNLAMAISVVLGGVVFQNGMEAQAEVLRVELGDSVAAKLSGKEAAANIVGLGSLDEHARDVVSAAYGSALRKMWIFFACTGAAALIASTFLRKEALSEVHERVEVGLEQTESKAADRLEMD